MHLPGSDRLLDALRDARRRYRMPPLPASARAAAQAGPATALAYAIEALRLAHERGNVLPSGELAVLFRRSLADLIRGAMQTPGGDPSFQALVLRERSPAVREHLRLAATRRADERAVRSVIDAIAHPRKPGAEAVAASWRRRHALMASGAWRELAREPADAFGVAAPAVQRLARGVELLEDEDVRRFLALGRELGPAAGSQAAAAHGRAGARAGAGAERAAVDAFMAIARTLDRHVPGHRVAHGLRTPRGFPGDAHKAKDEWDAAILQPVDAAGTCAIVLLAEVKASPASATSDFSRLHRGLERLSHAQAGRVYAFESAEGEVPIAGESLAALRPQGRLLPAHVIYCSTAEAEADVPMFSAASRSVLLGEAASLAFAQQDSPDETVLDSVWRELPHAPRLKSVLHQYDTSRAAREAMLHPDDLLAALR